MKLNYRMKIIYCLFCSYILHSHSFVYLIREYRLNVLNVHYGPRSYTRCWNVAGEWTQSWYPTWDLYPNMEPSQLASINKYIVCQMKMNSGENRIVKGCTEGVLRGAKVMGWS